MLGRVAVGWGSTFACTMIPARVASQPDLPFSRGGIKPVAGQKTATSHQGGATGHSHCGRTSVRGQSLREGLLLDFSSAFAAAAGAETGRLAGAACDEGW